MKSYNLNKKISTSDTEINVPTRLMLIYISNVRDNLKIDFPLGIAAISSHIQEKFYDTIKINMIHNLVEKNTDSIIKKIVNIRPHI